MKYVKMFEAFRSNLLKEEDGNRDTLGELKEMAMGQLERIEDYAEMIAERMEAGQELESWMYSQLTIALENLNSVHDAMDGVDGVKEAIVNEVSDTAYTIHRMTDAGQNAVQDFIDDNGLNAEKFLKYVKSNPDSKYDVRDYISGEKGTVGGDSKLRSKFIKMFKESALEEGKKPGPDAYMTGLDDETEEDKKAQMKKQAAMDDDDDSAYKDMPGDKEARENGTVKTSKHTKSYHAMYGGDKNESFLTEAEQSTDRSPIDDDGIETGLENKAEESGVPIGILRAVMRRGMAAWKTGHRPGTTAQQWGYARCNSFLTKQDGTWGGADKDLAKEVRDGGHDKDMK